MAHLLDGVVSGQAKEAVRLARRWFANSGFSDHTLSGVKTAMP